METIFGILFIVSVLVVFVWLIMPSRATTSPPGTGELIDPSDSRQIGLLVGMYGGDVADAAIARYALQRFEAIHGRKATTRDVGVVVGLMSEQFNDN
jgi:hypothetical protein